MLRINLLPREVLERRRYERWYPLAFLVFGVLLVLILIVYAYLLMSGAQRNADLQLLQEQTQKTQAQAQAFGVFEQKEQELATRQATGVAALKGRLNMGRLAEEVSLVLPDEVWLQTVAIDQTTGLTLTGHTPWSPGHTMDTSYKSVAKTLVRINELSDVSDVWLTNAADAQFSTFVPPGGTPAPTVLFSIEGAVKPPPAVAGGQSGVK